jgi:signal transduction histidine kinase
MPPRSTTAGLDAPASNLSWPWESLDNDWRSQDPAGFGLITTKEVCQMFVNHCQERLSCRMVNLWSLDPVRHKLILTAVAGATLSDLGSLVMDCSKHFSGSTVDRKVVTPFDDLKGKDQLGRTFLHSEIVDRFGLETMVSIPVLNTTNLNQVLLILNLFPERALKLFPSPSVDPTQEKALYKIADGLALKFEICLHNRNNRLANRLNLELNKVSRDHPKFQCKALAKLVKDSIGCDSVAVYLMHPDAQEIELQGAVGDVYPHETTKHLKDGPAERVWKSNREWLSLNVQEEEAVQRTLNSLRKNIGPDVLTGVFVPLRDLTGQSNGVIRCLNRCPDTAPDKLRPFTYEDVATIEAIGQAFAPHLDVILADQKRFDMMSKVAHELRVPIVAFGATVERIRTECEAKEFRFRYDHFRELEIYTDVMRRLLQGLDLVRKGPHRIVIEAVPTHLLSAIIAPTKRFLVPILRKRRFEEYQVKHSGFESLPKLHVDPALMTQVVFNLLENSIKYFMGEPRDFRAEIVAKRTDVNVTYTILFRDWGIGVPFDLRERIFDAGFRAPNAHEFHVAGEGIGLWLARTIVERHGGKLRLLNHQHPTEFLIELPASLADSPPPSHEDDTYEEDTID